MAVRPATPRRKIQRPEQRLHIAVAQFLRLAWPDDLLWFHVPNGGKRSKPEAALLKVMGVQAGVPDLLFVLPNGQLAGIELKAPDGRTSPEQDAFARRLLNLRCGYAEARSVEDVEAKLTQWLSKFGRRLTARVVNGHFLKDIAA